MSQTMMARPHSNVRDALSGSKIGSGRSSLGSNALWIIGVSAGVFQLVFFIVSHTCYTDVLSSNGGSQGVSMQIQSPNKRPIDSFWWPSPETSGGFLSAIHRSQHPQDCLAKSTKYFVMRSHKNNESDNRGLSAWASITMQLMLHAFSDGDNHKLGRRVLINDDRLWPMAKGCKHGSQTRECYFQPLTDCKLSDVDPIDTKNGSFAELAEAKDDYDRSARTLYSSTKSKYVRIVEDKISWSGLPGTQKDHSHAALIASFLAYNLQPQPWLRDEIDSRLRRSIPADLDPDKTIGVPIRRSDKCFGHGIAGSAGGELDCRPLEDYLDVVKTFVNFDPLVRNVIVTSEDKSACDEFVQLLKKELPNLRVVVNVGDVQQGTGSATKLEAYKEVNNEDVIASALTSFHMHLRAKYLVITTKSSWTSSIAIFARVFGFASDVYSIDIGRNKNFYADMARAGG